MRFIFLFLLLGISSLFAINSAYALEVNHESIDLSESESIDLVIMGNLNDYQSSTRLILTIVSPDGSTNDYDVRTTGKGAFSENFTITNDWKSGKYSVTGKYGDVNLDSTSFVIEEPYDPRIGMITSKSTETVEESGKTSEKTIKTSSEPPQIPDWVRNIALWYGQRSVSETEFINAVKFLIENKIIVVDTSVISESVSKTIEPSTEPTKVFPDPNVDPQTYVDRYLKEQSYRDWFDKNYPGKTIYGVVGLPEPTPTIVKETITKQPTNSKSITNNNFAPVFSNPDDYTGQWVKLYGEVTQKPFIDKNGLAIVFNISQNEIDYYNQKVWFVSNDSNLDIKNEDCFILEGPIKGKAGAENLFGASRDLPLITLEKISDISCLDAKYPAFKTLKIDESKTKGSIKFTLHEIQFSEEHTRVLVEVENLDNSYGITFYSHQSNILQGKSQFPAELYMFLDADYETIESEIPNNIVENGFIFFEPIGKESFKILFKATNGAKSWIDDTEYTFEFNVN